MARQKAISVKIATPKVIKALETRLTKLEADYASQEANEAKHEKAMEKWRKEVAKFAMANFAKAENLRTNYRLWNKTLNVDFDLTVNESDFPKEPEKDYEVLHRHLSLNNLGGRTKVLNPNDLSMSPNCSPSGNY